MIINGISIIVPVYNEEKTIVQYVQKLLDTQIIFPFEIIIVDAGETGKINVLLEKFKKHIRVLKSPQRLRSFQLHYGAEHAKYNYFFFLHADATLPQQWCKMIEEQFLQKTDKIAAVFKIKFNGQMMILRLIEISSFSRTKFLAIPYGDQGLFMSKDNYFKNGGFPPVAIMEEYVFYSKFLTRTNLVIIDACIRTNYIRVEHKISNVLRRWICDCVIAMLSFAGVDLDILARLYHRWR